MAPRKMDTLDFEVRFATEGDEGTFTGYAVIFGELNGHNEIVRPGAFKRSLAEHAARGTRPGLFWSHDPQEPIGTWTEIVEDARGLKVTGKLVLGTTRGREAYELIRAGALDGLSIGFRVKNSTRENGARILSDIELVEISPVSLPSAANARITSFRSKHGRAERATAFVESCRKAVRALKAR